MADETEVTEPEEENSTVRQLREHGKELESDLNSTKRELALLKAGVDLETPAGKMFAKAYDGKLETAEILEAAKEIPGVLKDAPEPAVETPEIPEDEQASTAERQRLASGAAPDAGITEDGRSAAKRIAEQARADGLTEEKILGSQFAALVQAGHQGDRSVLVPKRSPAVIE